MNNNNIPVNQESGCQQKLDAIIGRNIECQLDELGVIQLIQIESAADERYALWKALIENYHYIGHGKLYGLQIRYLIKSENYGWIGALSFSSAAWKLQARDNWVGWNDENRVKHLNEVVCNSRFLILPNVRVNNLASHILSIGLRQLKQDWKRKYGIDPLLVETFVEKERFSGTCYQAANFQYIGTTQGRGRQDRENKHALPVKDIYLYPLGADIKEQLCAGQPIETPRPATPVDWTEEELGEADLGDERLNKRLLEITRDFFANPGANVPQACQSRAKTKAVYRFFDNKEISMEKILQPHYQATIQRIGKEKVVLAVQDTTSLNYSTHEATEGIGPIGSSENKPIGLMVHDTMAFNLEGTPLGLLNVQCWVRDIEEYGKKHKRHELPIEAKESYKWLESFKAATGAQKENPKTVIVSVGDREADIYELFELALKDPKGSKLLVRAQHNRCSVDEKGEQSHVWDYIKSMPQSGIQRIKIPRKGKRPSREADLAIRFGEVELKAPQGKKGLANIKIWAVLAEEENATGVAEPVIWMLFTTIPVNTFEEAVEKVDWYSKRWGIEVFHKTLKSGCKIEDRQLMHIDRIESCLAIDMIIAWRIYHLTKLGREVPNVPCTVFFEEAEWKALVAYNTKNPIAPEQPPTLREAIRMVASIGGFLGRKGDGEPGTKTIWLGLQDLDNMTEMWKIFNGRSGQSSPAPP